MQNRMKCQESEHGKCGKLKISVQQNILELSFVEPLTFNDCKFNFKKKSSDSISTLYIFAYKSMLPRTILKPDGPRKAGVGGSVPCYVRCGKLCPAVSETLPRSLLHVTKVPGSGVHAVRVCSPWQSRLVTVVPSHHVTLKPPRSMLPDDTPRMPCSTPHSNTGRETVGYGTGDRCHSSTGLIFHLLW